MCGNKAVPWFVTLLVVRIMNAFSSQELGEIKIKPADMLLVTCVLLFFIYRLLHSSCVIRFSDDEILQLLLENILKLAR